MSSSSASASPPCLDIKVPERPGLIFDFAGLYPSLMSAARINLAVLQSQIKNADFDGDTHHLNVDAGKRVKKAKTQQTKWMTRSKRRPNWKSSRGASKNWKRL